jgi:hypothetical protein
MSTTRKAITPDVFLHTTKNESPFSLSYEVECTALNSVEVTLDFTGSKNFRFIPSPAAKLNGAKLTGKIKPYSKQAIGSAVLIDENDGYSLKTGCSVVVKGPDEQDVAEYMNVKTAVLEKLIEDTKQLTFPFVVDDPNHTQVREICLASGMSFIDQDFPPNETAAYSPQNLLDRDQRKKTLRAIEWKRPKDFLTAGQDIKVFEGKIEANDIKQGQISIYYFLNHLFDI